MARRGADTDYDTHCTLIVQPHLARAARGLYRHPSLRRAAPTPRPTVIRRTCRGTGSASLNDHQSGRSGIGSVPLESGFPAST